MNITPALIRRFKPCYDPSKYLTEDYSKPLVEFLQEIDIPVQDRMWLFIALPDLNEQKLKFSLRVARRGLIKKGDSPGIISDIDALELYLNSEDKTKIPRLSAKAVAWLNWRLAAYNWSNWEVNCASGNYEEQIRDVIGILQEVKTPISQS